jgi:hypothetical protein
MEEPSKRHSNFGISILCRTKTRTIITIKNRHNTAHRFPKKTAKIQRNFGTSTILLALF